MSRIEYFKLTELGCCEYLFMYIIEYLVALREALYCIPIV